MKILIQIDDVTLPGQGGFGYRASVINLADETKLLVPPGDVQSNNKFDSLDKRSAIRQALDFLKSML